jgi:hypothetical protein
MNRHEAVVIVEGTSEQEARDMEKAIENWLQTVGLGTAIGSTEIDGHRVHFIRLASIGKPITVRRCTLEA